MILCIILVIGAALLEASCENSKNRNNALDNSHENSGIASNENDIEKASEPERANTPDNVSADLNFGGSDFTILTREELMFGIEMGVEEINGDIINDAIYQRNRYVEERFDININIVKRLGIWGNEGQFNDAVRNSVKAGDNAYDLIAGYSVAIAPLAAEGMFTNWNTVPHIDYNSPWWVQKLADELTIDGKLYFMTGDLSLTMIGNMMVFYYNKSLQANYGIEDLYQTVLDGKWTYDKLYDISKSVYNDINGDGEKNLGDTFGLGVEPGNFTDQLFVSMGQSLTQKGDDGYPYLVVNSPGTYERLDRIIALFHENPGVYRIPESGERPTREMFRRGESLFCIGYLEFAENLRDMKDDFGIIPSPKYDEAQKKYLGLTQDGFSLFCIPITSERLDFVGAITETMAAESYRHLTPAYYETALKVKYARDEVTAQMLDIIRNGIYFDFGYVNTTSINGIHFLLRDMVERNNRDFLSTYEKRERQYEAALQKLLEAYNSYN